MVGSENWEQPLLNPEPADAFSLDFPASSKREVNALYSPSSRLTLLLKQPENAELVSYNKFNLEWEV